jgi:hypothetical protein
MNVNTVIQKFELLMVLRKTYTYGSESRRTYIVGSDGASRVSRDKLELHINISEKKLVVGLEARARGFVEWKAKKVAVVKHLPSAISPRDVEVLVEVSSSKSHGRAKKGKSQKHKWNTWPSGRSHRSS